MQQTEIVPLFTNPCSRSGYCSQICFLGSLSHSFKIVSVDVFLCCNVKFICLGGEPVENIRQPFKWKAWIWGHKCPQGFLLVDIVLTAIRKPFHVYPASPNKKIYSLKKKTFSSGDDGLSLFWVYFFLTDYPSSPVAVEYLGHFQNVNKFHRGKTWWTSWLTICTE